MINRDDQETLPPDVVSSAFALSYGNTIGPLIFQNLKLEKQLQMLQARNIEIETVARKFEEELQGRPSLDEVNKLKTIIQDLENQKGGLIDKGPTFE